MAAAVINNSLINIYNGTYFNVSDNPVTVKNSYRSVIQELGATYTTISADLQNNGSIIVGSGNLTALGSWINNDTIKIGKNAYFNNNAVLTLNYGSVINGGGTLINARTLNINFNFLVPKSLYVIARSMVKGTGKITVDGRLEINNDDGYFDIPIVVNPTGVCKFTLANISKSLVNNGEVDFVGNFLYLEGTTFTNNNLVTTGSRFVLNSSYRHKTKFINNGIITQTGNYPSSSFEATFPFINTATGNIKGVGTYGFDSIINNGMIEPGNPGGTMAFSNDFFSSTSTLNINFQKDKKGKVVIPKVMLLPKYTPVNGTLNIIQLADTVPPGDYIIVENTYGNITDTFKTVNKPANWSIIYKTTQVIIHVPDNNVTQRNTMESSIETETGNINISVQSNPVTSILKVQIDTKIPLPSHLQIFNERGLAAISLNSGINNFEYAASAWPKGIYFIKIIGRDGSVSQTKFIKE